MEKFKEHFTMVQRGGKQNNIIGDYVYSYQSYGSGLSKDTRGCNTGLESIGRQGIALHDNSGIMEGSNYATFWCSRTVHKTIGYLGWSCRKMTTKKITNLGMYLIEGTPNN